MRYCCSSPRRLQAVTDAGVLNAIAFLEVSDTDAPTSALRQRTLIVTLLQPPAGLVGADVVIEGGVRIATVGVMWAAAGDDLPPGESPDLLADVEDPARVLVVRTDSTGDFSRYTLRLGTDGGTVPPPGFDPQLASVEFSFKVECPSDFDCEQDCFCTPPDQDLPTINYLARDFPTFRQLMLDRMSLLTPTWTDRHTADVGIAMVELLAYVADQLTYRQDAIATEAYLATARSRISLRRHARLVDYRISEGCNARAYVQILVAGPVVAVPAGTQLITETPQLRPRVLPDDPTLQAALDGGIVEVFETVESAVLDQSLAQLSLWTWGELDCCLPVGSTSATLLGAHPTLRAGDVLVLAESLSPTTGSAADADPTHRAAVRLTGVVIGSDPSGGLFAEPPTADALDITSIAWDPADALTFPLCVSARGGRLQVAVVLGNIVLADHGRTLPARHLGPVPAPDLAYVAPGGCGCDAAPDPVDVPVRFRPTLPDAPLTFAASSAAAELFRMSEAAAPLADLEALDFTPTVQAWLQGHGQLFIAGPAVVTGLAGDWSVSDGSTVVRVVLGAGDVIVTGRRPGASTTLPTDPRAAVPALTLTETATSLPWPPVPDLLTGDGSTRGTVVELDTDGSARLRFGDGEYGLRPPAGLQFDAVYRIGNGTAGNVGAGAIAHIVSSDDGLLGVTNPMPAGGGQDAETPFAIRRDAPQAYLVQERAVTQDDYATMALLTSGVADAAATFRWTGSWHTAFVTADRTGGLAVDAPFRTALATDLDAYRMAGYDLQIDAPVMVALRIEMFVCVRPEYLRDDVHRVLATRMGSGAGGLFRPDAFTFEQPVYLSSVIAAAQQVTGVQSVEVRTFQRMVDDPGLGLRDGVLTMGRLEIARCDSDPDFPERGVLILDLGGGR